MHMGETKRRERLILESALALQMMPIHSFIVISVWMCPRYMYNNIVNQSCALASFVFPEVDLISVLLASTALDS